MFLCRRAKMAPLSGCLPLARIHSPLALAAAPATAEPPTRAATPDLEWTKWVRVSWWAGNSQPAWLDRDAARQYALDTLQPDIVDWYQVIQTEQLSCHRNSCLPHGLQSPCSAS